MPGGDKLKRQESIEDYLETILLLKNKLGNVRSIDIAMEMNYSKPSISVAMKNLREKELVTIDNSGYISFTEAGRFKAERVYERHTVLMEALKKLGVSENTAKEDACKIEHDLSEETFEKIKAYLNKTK